VRPSLPTASASSRAGRARLIQIAKAVLGFGLLAALLLWQDNGRKLLDVLAQFDPDYIIMLLLISLGLNGISSVKWSLFIHERGIEISQLRLFNLYLIGKFFNNFLPSMVGGDIARTYLLGRLINSHSRSFASVFLERATGVVGLTLLAAGFALAKPEILGNPIILLAITAAVFGCAVALVVFYCPSFVFGPVGRFGKLPLIGSLPRKIKQVVRDVTYFRHRQRLLLLSLAYSFGFHLLAGMNVYVACLSIGLGPELTEILVITPVILLLAMIPVSPNNIGWWEWCFSILLVDAGATVAEGLAVALTIRAATIVMSVLGGLLFLQQRFVQGTP
jgi:glycosyltransferase 2 family protein